MRFQQLPTQSEIDNQLERSKPRQGITRPLPWAPALIGLGLMILMQSFL
jgi:hypothetical protein